MISERQRIEAAPSPSIENNVSPPPAYEDVNGGFASQTQNGTTDSMGYFLGEVNDYQLLFDYIVKTCLRSLPTSISLHRKG